jgi:hypothetical protein
MSAKQAMITDARVSWMDVGEDVIPGSAHPNTESV